jgi:DNA polymerase/3'-5' exonuclease PolX
MNKIYDHMGIDNLSIMKDTKFVVGVNTSAVAPPTNRPKTKMMTDVNKSIPRAEATEHVEFIVGTIPTAIITGSYRRGAMKSKDVDVLIRMPISVAISKLGKKYVIEKVRCGAVKCTLIVQLPGRPKRLLDLMKTTSAEHPFALLHMTGSKEFNILMRIKARRKGMLLNERGLFEDGQLVGGIKTERDIFKALGMEYVLPAQRGGAPYTKK